MASPCAAAFCYHSTALAASFGTPSPLAYINPRLDCALATPCAAAFCHHSAALAASFGTPSPLRYVTPSLYIALVSPESAPFCNCAKRFSAVGAASCFDGDEGSPQALTTTASIDVT